MALLILTPTNLKAAKRALRTALPNVGSVHLSEALAASLGFRTHAALLVGMDAEPLRPPPLADAEFARFAERLFELGYDAPPPSTLADIIHSEIIQDRPWAEFSKGNRTANDTAYYRCQRLNQPLLTIEVARRYARLEWDCITILPSQEEHLHDEPGTQLARKMFAQFQARAKDAPGQPEFLGSAFTGRIDRLLPDTARCLADDYFQMLYEPLCHPAVAA